MNNQYRLLCSFIAFTCTILNIAQEPMPTDPNIVYGKLSNGLTYIIRHNEYPSERANFYIAQRVGATLEEDNQNGLAHFLEHMAFNGSKNFKGNDMIDYLETIGVEYGRELNAYTSLDETVYNIDNVPTNRSSIIDSVLLILHDWSGCLLLEGKGIEKERGIIMEEWRTRNSAEDRLYFAHNRSTMPGTKYAKRDIIGDTAVINNFKSEELISYYKKWYRPDLQCIIIVGDINPQDIVLKIEQLWSDITTPIDAPERKYDVIPNNAEPIVSIATDIEATTTNYAIRFRQDPAPVEIRQTQPYFETLIILEVISDVMNTRFSDIAKSPDAPIVLGDCEYYEEVKTKDAFIFEVEAKQGFEADAYTLIVDEIEKLRRFGLTEGEYERACANIIKKYENKFNARAKRQNSSYTESYVNTFFSNNAMISDSLEYEIARTSIPKYSIEIINQFIKFFTKNNVVITISAPKTTNIQPQNAILNEYLSVGNKQLTPYENELFNKPLIYQEPISGELIKENKNKLWSADEWILSNGIHVYLMPTNFADNEVLINIKSKGGYSLYEPQDVISASSACDIINACGLGEFSARDLRKVLTGKSVNIINKIEAYSEWINASSSTNDIETMLQLIYLKFLEPREDKKAFNAYLDKIHNSLVNSSSEPRNVFKDTIYSAIGMGNPYEPNLTLDNFNMINYDNVFRIYKERFSNASDFNFVIVGDFNKDEIKHLILKWIGGIATTNKSENYIYRNTSYPKGIHNHRFSKQMHTNKVTVHTIYSGEKEYDRKLDLTINILGYLLGMRYDATMREEKGGTYGVSCGGTLSKYPEKKEISLTMLYETAPELFEILSPIIENEIEKIATDGPNENDLAKIKENLLKTHKDQLKENRTWLSIISDKLFFDIDLYSNYEDIINGISNDDIKNIAQFMLNQKNKIDVIMEPRNDNKQ